jgi:DNA processing protein
MSTKTSDKPPERSFSEEHQFAAAAERQVGITIAELSSLLALEAVKGFGPQKFKELHEAGITPTAVLSRPEHIPFAGTRGKTLKAGIAAVTDEDRALAQRRAIRQIARAADIGARVLTYVALDYPRRVYASNNPIPVLYLRGAAGPLNAARAVACVGSRKIRPPYSELHHGFATAATKQGFVIVSGFAIGADRIGHEAAVEAGAETVLVMPSGLDRPFPPENRDLWAQLTAYEGAAIVSEFPLGTSASTLTLRKRNKLIVAFAEGVLISQSEAKGGAMNAYRFAVEQRKPIATFQPDGAEDTSGNVEIACAGDSRDVKQLVLTEQPKIPSRVSVLPRDAGPHESAEWLDSLSS